MGDTALYITDDKEDECFVVIEKEEGSENHKIFSTRELLLNIFCSIPVKGILKMRLVCRLWNDILQDDHTWQKLFEMKYGKVSDSLLLNDSSYKSICLFKEYDENELWNNALSIIKEPTTSPNLQRYKLFGEMASLNSYLYDVINTSTIENGIAIAFVAQRPLVRNEQMMGGITILEERPTLLNTDFALVPNIEIEIYLKIIKFNGQDTHKVRLCDIQRITATHDDIGMDVNWIKNVVRMEFGKEYYMYSLDVSLGACKIFSYDRDNSLCNFNVGTPPITEMALSNNMLVVVTESGIIQVTNKSIIKRHRQEYVDLTNNEKFHISLKDVALRQRSPISFESMGQASKARIHSFYLDQNDFMIISYVNVDDENVFRCWDLRGVTNHVTFGEDFNYRKHVFEYLGKLPTKAHSFAVRWRNSKKGSYEHNPCSQQQEDIIPEIIVTCSGGLVLIYHPVKQQLNTSLITQNELKLVWKISTGLTSCKMIDTSFWAKDNFPKGGNWLFLTAKRLIGDIKTPIVLQFLLPGLINTNNNRGVTSHGYTCIDDYNPNEEQNLQNTSVITTRIQYTHLVHRIISDKIPNAGSIVQVMTHLPHSLLIICQRKEPDLIRPRPKFATYIYDYHTSLLTSNPQRHSPFLYLLPTGYFIMAPKRSFKDDIVFVPLPNLKSRTKFLNSISSTKTVKPKLAPGSNKLKVNRKSGTKRGKQPKGTKIEKRKRNQSSKIAYSPRDLDIDYDDEGFEDFEDFDDLDLDLEDDYVYYGY